MNDRLILLSAVILLWSASAAAEVRIGSKAFTEGFVLAELAAQRIEFGTEERVVRHFGLGNTGIVYESLRQGEIDLYPEYTGTIAEAILRTPGLRDFDELARRLDAIGFFITRPLGFSNTYALAVTREFAFEHGLKNISDLHRVVDRLRAAFSHEFVKRTDGLEALLEHYRLDLRRDHQALEHSLAYEAIAHRKVDLIDVYTTDARLSHLDLVVLGDDLDFFPAYQAVYLARREFVDKFPEAWAAVRTLESSLSEEVMINLNASVEMDKKSVGSVIRSQLNPVAQKSDERVSDIGERIWRRTKEHSILVSLTVLLSVLTGVPLGIVAAKSKRLGQILLLASSLVQTIPSLALLCLLIPLFGIGKTPALVALYMYSLLPILLNTMVGLRSIDPSLLETARALGIGRWRRVIWIELPLASRSVLGGVKTATIIGIGTATLAALIGAGGYGAPIVSGLAMNDTRTVLSGAVPAAVMSLFAHFAFEAVAAVVIPKGLR